HSVGSRSRLLGRHNAEQLFCFSDRTSDFEDHLRLSIHLSWYALRRRGWSLHFQPAGQARSCLSGHRSERDCDQFCNYVSRRSYFGRERWLAIAYVDYQRDAVAQSRRGGDRSWALARDAIAIPWRRSYLPLWACGQSYRNAYLGAKHCSERNRYFGKYWQSRWRESTRDHAANHLLQLHHSDYIEALEDIALRNQV